MKRYRNNSNYVIKAIISIRCGIRRTNRRFLLIISNLKDRLGEVATDYLLYCFMMNNALQPIVQIHQMMQLSFEKKIMINYFMRMEDTQYLYIFCFLNGCSRISQLLLCSLLLKYFFYYCLILIIYIN